MAQFGWLLREPWSLLNPDEKLSRQPLSTEASEYSIAGTGTSCLALPSSVQYVRTESRRESLPAISVPFNWDGQQLQHRVLPSNNRLGSSDAPFVDALEEIALRTSDATHRLAIRQTNSIARPQPRKETEDTASIGHRLENFIDWEVGCFEQLLDLDFAPSDLDSKTTMGLFRRSWRACGGAWLRHGIEDPDPARMALIVRIAQDKQLCQRLEKLCRHPRRILERHRNFEHIGRIQQMDAACLRWYARQPGRTPAEKAGASQKLMAVQRRESFDTLENKVLKWVLERCRTLASRYLVENAAYREKSTRYSDVNRLSRFLVANLRSEPICNISSKLPQPLQPNYQLQQHADYRKIWQTYKKLLANQRLEDDAWRWQRVLWKESCAQIFSACLTHPDVPLQPLWTASTAYIREESQVGRRTESPSTPGPFRYAEQRVDLVDPQDGAPPVDWCPWLGALGGDMALISRDPNGRVVRGSAIWFHQDWTPELDFDGVIARCGEALRRQMEIAELYSQSSLPIDGLLLMNGSGDASRHDRIQLEHIDVGKRGAGLVAMRLPPDLHEHVDDVLTGVQLAVDALLSTR
jgi:hypothetical protein